MHQNYQLPEQDIFLSGHAACPGCGEAIALRLILSVLGSRVVLVVPPSCISIIVGPQPLSSIRLPIYQTAFETSASAVAGISRALKATGQSDVLAVAVAGDGGTYDIGFQALSSVAERNEDILYICLNNEGYMNTGVQKSSATPLGAWTTSTPDGKPLPRKNMVEIMSMHRIPYCATATIGYPDDLAAKVQKAKSIKGTRYIDILTPCIAGWGISDKDAVRISRLAVEAGYYPLYEIENGQAYTINRNPGKTHDDSFFRIQKRFNHLSPDKFEMLLEEIKYQWKRILQMVKE